jgi:hypothetical protein
MSAAAAGMTDHTFVVPVYREAPNLGALIRSLRAQNGGASEILLATSTPSPQLRQFADGQGLPLHVNARRADIATDWNFALGLAVTARVTLAHQDDLFESTYVAQLSAALAHHPDAVLAFCDYSEHTPYGVRSANINLRIKRGLCRRAFGARECLTRTRDKLRLLSLGNPICCPSVMLNRRLLPQFRFPGGFQTNLDWMAWLELARSPGGFVYVRQSLVSKGVHAASETSATIASRAREREDRAMFAMFWPRPLAAVLAAVYRLGYLGNRVRRSQPD